MRIACRPRDRMQTPDNWRALVNNDRRRRWNARFDGVRRSRSCYGRRRLRHRVKALGFHRSDSHRLGTVGENAAFGPCFDHSETGDRTRRNGAGNADQTEPGRRKIEIFWPILSHEESRTVAKACRIDERPAKANLYVG